MHASRRTQQLVIVGGTTACMLCLYVVCELLHGFRYNNDFRTEAWPAYQALYHGHVTEFLRLGPAYIGSLILRAPFAMVAMALGGGWRATYFVSAVPCLAAAPLLAVWLANRREFASAGPARIWTNPLVLLALNPLFVFCMVLGHPEEVLGACLSIAAVVLASEGESTGIAGLVLGLAVANKPWALAVVPVVFVVMPARRVRALVTFVVTAGLLYLPVVLVHYSGSGVAASLGSGTGTIFYPTWLGWWLGPQAWVSHHAHMLIVVVPACCCVAWWLLQSVRRSPPERRCADALSLLALVLMLRGALDPWNNIYYELPFVMTLMAIETNRRPRLSLLFTVILFVVLRPGGIFTTSVNLRAIAFDVVVVPTLALLAVRVYASPAVWRRIRIQALTPRGPQAAAAGASGRRGVRTA